jgi:hypothetical protein
LFRQSIDLLSFNSCDYGLYIDTFYACRQLYIYLNDFYTDLVADNNIDSNDKSIYTNSNNSPLADFKIFARRRPYNNLTYSFIDNPNSCNLDRIYDWILYIGYNLIIPEK